ncbi:MAG TPA: DNA (cytosine-5-)-methyltransferase [Phycisphaerales bacterium]|nr:DNA (cytosine-5-)-methyltransferase [Phycisphaerales bacterium]HMP38638.1 DNA (cytosine-5-)-methyltransferase [Phycisphaerales bacterium]
MIRATPNANGRVGVELCAGLGGIGIGLRALGFKIAKAYDSWNEAVEIYNHNFGDGVAAVANLLSEKGRRLIEADHRRIGEIELVAAGPPCKGFSKLRNGHHDGRNGHNRVLAAMPDYVAILRPRLILIENVPDLVRHRDGKTLANVLERLERPAKRLRYRVEYKVYDAALSGTPQARRRVLIFGVRGGGKERLPEPGPDLAPLFAAVRHKGTVPKAFEKYLAALMDPENTRLTSASQALSDLPILGPGEPEAERPYASGVKTAFQRWVRNGAPERLRDTRTPAVNAETVKRLHHIPPGGCARVIPKEHLNGLSRRYGSAYRRLHPDAPSTALSTKYDCVYHYEEDRSLSVREYARLQGIPDYVTFPSTVVCRRSAYEMIGNSVPPLLIEGVLGEAMDRGNGGAKR